MYPEVQKKVFLNVMGVLLPPELPKIWYIRCRRYLIFYLSYDYVTWYTYRLCCPD